MGGSNGTLRSPARIQKTGAAKLVHRNRQRWRRGGEPREYSDYITERRYRSNLFDVADKNRDGMLDFEEFLTLHFIYNQRGYTSCKDCSVVLLGIHFVCVKCYDAGKDYDLCCKCYGNKSYSHLDDHTDFRDIYSLLELRKPKPASAAYLDPDQAKLMAGLNSAIIREKPNVKWNDVAGLESAKQALQEAVMLPVKFLQFFVGKRRPWRAFLLYGPPGTGKSFLAKAIATEADSTFFSISSSDLLSKWMGESGKLVSKLFQMARDSAPSIIFIDEIDFLGDQRGEGNESETSRRIKTEVLVQMQGVGRHTDGKVLVLAATNTPYALDQAIRRRFDRRIYIPLPDLKARQHMLKVHLGDTPHNLTESDFKSLAPKTEDFSGSDIAVCVNDVLFEPVRKAQHATYFVKTPGGLLMPCEPKQPGAVQTTMQELAAKGLASKITLPPITKMDFDKVLARQRPTVSKADLEVHERFTKEFGEAGR
ncbi:hypothetical protein RHGRI_003701 [Rhododendron griersonianum]|uniref:EF-hand domain-containing protein n=1 Tax=Rhododendron griersonianum TaxID=479676 RepID=A0AAV6L8Y7_9ERIC|nr:hypothetical protein RHGRI_003701 [Rhododendron griersonianum]